MPQQPFAPTRASQKMTLNITTETLTSHVSLFLEGEVDTTSAPQLLQTLTEIGLAELAELRIHAMSLTFMSSAGLRALVYAKQKMPHSSRLIFVGGSADIQEVITRTGLGNAVMLVETVDDIP
ncbi:STAS domain-containing protein [Synechococcus sp. 1G10]|uniref:STAS domain-containing protein n=1 Tax=Synechococcus sp. 1G10 TaxID=2025605 RepID=UPI001E3B796F|nr:STAS domain-containing protein [Synechococcus sp. 1G10]